MQLSYTHGVAEEPLLGETVGHMFDRIATLHPEHEALVVPFQGIRWTFGELAERVDRYAAGLLALGLRPGDRIGIWSPNNAEWVLLQLASAKAGLILVNINPAYRLAELEYALNTVECRALVVAPALKSSNYLRMLYELLPELTVCVPGALVSARVPTLSWVIRLGGDRSPGMVNFASLPDRARSRDRERFGEIATRLQFDDPINIQFTSGTTGTPKAATLTHHNIVNNAYFVARQMRLSVIDKMCIPVPMYHCFGMVLGTLCSMTHGATMVLPSESFDPATVLQTVGEERCTILHGVPTMFIAELEDAEFERHDLSSLRTGIMAGAPCPEELMKRVMDRMHLRQITIAYGMTETGPVSFQTHVEDSVERRVTTVGRVLPHTEVKIVDGDKRIVPRGTPGELHTRGYCVMRGYWNDAKRTAEAIDSAHWMASGDLALLDEEGYCKIVGRIKDMLIRGGENIYPREIEECLYQNPKIDAAEVVGVPDPKYGEEVCAWIKLHARENATKEEIREFCRGKIAHFKIPRYIKFVEEFPMTITGKVQKFVIRERMARELGASGGGAK